jgi:hypothetical protein
MDDLFEKIRNKYRVTEANDDQSTRTECFHSQTELINQYYVCVDCGEMLYQKVYNEKPQHVYVQERKRNICTIYEELPYFIDYEVKHLAVELYNYTTSGKIFRNILRRAILLACLHRASIILNKQFFFEHMVELFNLKIHNANKGIVFVSENIPKSHTEYKIPYCNEEINIKAIVTSLDICRYLKSIINLYSIVKANSTITNTSHSKSVICGCIWFYLQFNRSPISLKQFSLKCNCAKMTIQRKYTIILKTIYRLIMKSLFSSLLVDTQIFTSNSLNIKSSSINNLTDGIVVIKNYDDPILISVIDDADNFVYPLDEVDNLLDWNILFKKIYYDIDGKGRDVGIKIKEDLSIDFSQFDKFSKNSGNLYLKEKIDKILT